MVRTSVAVDISVGDEILSRLADLGADLLVMGAYGHSRMRELVERNEPIDLVTLPARLKDHGELEKVGGMSYLAELSTASPSAANAMHYADAVSRKHLMRSLIEASYEIGEKAYDESRDPVEILDEAEKTIYAIGDRATTHKFTAIGETLEGVWDSLEERSKDKGGVRESITEGVFPEEVDSEIFSASEGEVVGPIETEAGTYVFQVDSAKEESVAPLDESRPQIEEQLKGQVQQEAFSAFLSDYRDRWVELIQSDLDAGAWKVICSRCTSSPKTSSSCPIASAGRRGTSSPASK